MGNVGGQGRSISLRRFKRTSKKFRVSPVPYLMGTKGRIPVIGARSP